jgi:hypothetical protein
VTETRKSDKKTTLDGRGQQTFSVERTLDVATHRSTERRESENFGNSREIEAERRNCRKAEPKGGTHAKVAVGNE